MDEEQKRNSRFTFLASTRTARSKKKGKEYTFVQG